MEERPDLGRYKALCNERDSVDVKKYDCFFAFGNESFARGMKGIRLNDGEKITVSAQGAMVQKTV